MVVRIVWGHLGNLLAGDRRPHIRCCPGCTTAPRAPGGTLQIAHPQLSSNCKQNVPSLTVTMEVCKCALLVRGCCVPLLADFRANRTGNILTPPRAYGFIVLISGSMMLSLGTKQSTSLVPGYNLVVRHFPHMSLSAVLMTKPPLNVTLWQKKTSPLPPNA